MKRLLLAILFFFFVTPLYAAHFVISSTESNNGQPITVAVSLDADNDEISGISGDLSFPQSLLSLGGISLKGSVVSLWPLQPNVSKDAYIDGRIHIPFEAIFPGGFSGVRSAYYDGKKPGILFTMTLLPEQVGKGEIILDDLSINSFSSDAHALPVSEVVTPVNVIRVEGVKDRALPRQIENTTLQAFITRDPLVSSGKWYLMYDELLSPSPVKATYVAESDHSLSDELHDMDWHEVSMPYVLFYQDRLKYVHLKIEYQDGTYVIRTLPPVENFKKDDAKLGILVLIGGVIFLLLLYAKTVLSTSTNHKAKA